MLRSGGMDSALRLSALCVTLLTAACVRGWVANHPSGRGTETPNEVAVIDEVVHKATLGGEDDHGAHACLTPCPPGLTCDAQTGECASAPVAPPEGGPQLH
jgi:hypothetical protein